MEGRHPIDAEWLKQLVAEQLVTVRTKRGFSRLEWQKLRERNEALDCRTYARGGKDIKFNQPASVGSYGEYKRASLHTIAAGFRVPYELLTGDLSQVNYSSIRAGLVEFRRLIDAVQWTVDVVWSTGERVRRGGFLREPYDEELSLDPEHVRLARLNVGAPRFHRGGLLPGERPILAKDGEAVFTPRQMDNVGALLKTAMRPSVVVNVQNNASGTEARAAVRDTGDGLEIGIIVETIEDSMGRNIQKGQGLAPLLETKYRLNPSAGAVR